MIERYTRAEMGAIWTLENRFEQMLRVEKAVARAQSRLGLIPNEAAEAIGQKGKFELSKILELEKTTKHDVIAFVSNVAENVGEFGRFVHFGLTSSDVIDTALSLLCELASGVLLSSITKLQTALSGQIKKHAETLVAGRTHGMHAEPTSFGMKLAGHLKELTRNRNRRAST